VVLAPVAGVKLAEAKSARPGPAKPSSADDGDKTNSSPGRARNKPLKPLRAGMPGVSGGPVVTTLVCFTSLCARGCGCSGHPAFPTPSGRQFVHDSGVSRRGSAAVCLKFERHHCCVTSKRAAVPFREAGLLLPPPWRGRVGEGGEPQAPDSRDPHPPPPKSESFARLDPARGRGARAYTEIAPQDLAPPPYLA
jgi:hypothetical protein